MTIGTQAGPPPGPPDGSAGGRSLNLLLGAFGDPGHAFPMIALGRSLVARGHRVTMQTWARWRDAVEGEGMSFAAAPEYHVFPTRPRPMKPYEAVVAAAGEIAPLLEDLSPDAVVADILTLAPALAGERAGVPVATLIPHVHPATAPGFPVYSIGARMPRTAAGRSMWGRLARVSDRGLQQGRGELNETRRRLDLPPLAHVHGGISGSLALVGTFPALEYPRPWPASVKVVGPLMWEPPFQDVGLPPGDEPLVLIAPSTSQDPDHRLLEAALHGLADAPVRVLATWNRRPPPRPLTVPENARVVEWISYSRTMPHCDAVVCHGGHGTVARALSSGCTVVACPAGGDMNENAARVDWAGVGVRLPRRYVSARPLRMAVMRAVEDVAMRERAMGLAAWAAEHDSGRIASELVEGLALNSSTVSPGPAHP